ncbi:MAG TPA: nitrilase, partial [Alphaproteobacteria bacterium]|nr:nitrilase [Alphaproteobacteria bacterium]
AAMIMVPAAFTYPSGRAHWHVLLRARAIETGCFVVAAAQCGTHADGRRTYGHAVIISPWGKVVAEVPTDDDDTEAGANDGIALATLDHGMVAKARDAIPSLTTNPDFSRDG